MNQFTATASATGILIKEITTGKTVNTYFTPNDWMNEASWDLQKGKKDEDWQYFLNISKFIREYSTNHMSKNLGWKQRFERIAKVINGLQSAKSFRNLSNQMRKAFDDGKTLSHAEFQKLFFYEGNMRKPATV